MKLPVIIGIIGFLLLLRLGVAYSHVTQLRDGEQVLFSTTLFSEPTLSNRSQIFYAVVPSQNQLGIGSRVQIVAPKQPLLHYGDTVTVSGKIKAEEYKGQIQYSLVYPVVKLQPKNAFYSVLAEIQKHLLSFFSAVLPSDAAALLLGIVFGIKGTFSQTISQDFKTTGVTHVIAASGMNVTMVAAFLSVLLTKLLKRQYAIIAIAAGLFFYAALSGFSASIVRASIMAGFAFSAQLIGRQYSGYYILFLTGAIMLLAQPQLLSDVGFQLSFLSTLGILVFSSLLRGSSKHLLSFVVGEDVATTFSAQVVTIPVLLLTFGQYGLLSIVVNALVLWMIPILMVLGGVSAILSFILPPVAGLFLLLSLPLLQYFLFVVEWFGSLNLTLTIPHLPIPIILGYYLLLCSVVLMIKGKKPKIDKNTSIA